MSENMFNELTHEEALVAWMETTWLFGCKEGGAGGGISGQATRPQTPPPRPHLTHNTNTSQHTTGLGVGGFNDTPTDFLRYFMP